MTIENGTQQYHSLHCGIHQNDTRENDTDPYYIHQNEMKMTLIPTTFTRMTWKWHWSRWHSPEWHASEQYNIVTIKLGRVSFCRVSFHRIPRRLKFWNPRNSNVSVPPVIYRSNSSTFERKNVAEKFWFHVFWSKITWPTDIWPTVIWWESLFETMLVYDNNLRWIIDIKFHKKLSTPFLIKALALLF